MILSESELDLGRVDGNVHALAVVLDRDDVAALGGDQREELDQLPRPVGEVRANDQVAPGRGQAVTHHRDEHRRVDVAAREEGYGRSFARHLPRKQRRDADRAGTFDDELRALEEQHDRLADLIV